MNYTHEYTHIHTHTLTYSHTHIHVHVQVFRQVMDEHEGLSNKDFVQIHTFVYKLCAIPQVE